MAKYTVHKGNKYAARIELNLFESVASNDTIKEKFVEVGFADVTVSGSGSERIAHGTWKGETTTAEMPSQITEVKDLGVATA